MPENWPATLPQAWLQDGYQETMPEVIVRTEMDAGPAKTRRRFTAQVTPIKARMHLTADQKGYFEAFFNTTLKGGALSFYFPHDGSDTFRFAKPLPALSPKGGTRWLLDCNLEKLP